MTQLVKISLNDRYILALVILYFTASVFSVEHQLVPCHINLSALIIFEISCNLQKKCL